MSKLTFEVIGGKLKFQHGEGIGSFGAPDIGPGQAFTELADYLRRNGLSGETPVTLQTDKGYAVLGA